MFTIMFHVLLYMANGHNKNKQHGHCVTQFQYLILYTLKELFILEKPITEFHEKYYTSAIQKLDTTRSS